MNFSHWMVAHFHLWIDFRDESHRGMEKTGESLGYSQSIVMQGNENKKQFWNWTAQKTDKNHRNEDGF